MSAPSTADLLGEDGSENPSQYRERLLVRLGAVEDERRALRTRFNQTSPIAKVPPEVVSEIMKIMASSSSDPSWMRTTQIFGEWRQIALRDPTLWGNLSFKHPDLTREMLARSGTAPLSINFTRGTAVFASVLRSALCNAGRLREITIHVPSHVVLDLKSLFVGTTEPLAILERLSLRSIGPDIQHWPFRLANVQAPSLCHLDIRNLAIPSWGSLPLGPALTELSLCRNSFAHNVFGRLGKMELLNSLQQLPNLITLELDQCMSPDFVFPVTNPITLPPLRSFVLRDCHADITGFLASLKIHDSTSVTITCSFMEDPGVDVDSELLTRLLTTLKTSWPISQSGIRKLRFIDSFFDDLSLDNQALVASFAGGQPCAPDFNLTIEDGFDEWGGMTIGMRLVLDAFTAQFDLSPLTFLEVKSDEATWCAPFGRLRQLREVTFGYSNNPEAAEVVPLCIQAFARSLNRGPATVNADGSTTDAPLPFPALKRVNLVGAGRHLTSRFSSSTLQLLQPLASRPESAMFALSLKRLPENTPSLSCWTEGV